MEEYSANWKTLETASERLREISRASIRICDELQVAVNETRPVWDYNNQLAVKSERILQSLAEQAEELRRSSETLLCIGRIYCHAEQEVSRLVSELPYVAQQISPLSYIIPIFPESERDPQDSLVMWDWVRHLSEKQPQEEYETSFLPDDDSLQR